MYKHNVLIALISLALLTLAVTATANAEFRADTNNATTGALDLPGRIDITLGADGMLCLSGQSGFWTIQTAEEIVSANGEVQTQPPTKQGPHEAQTIQKWGVCVLRNGTNTLATTVSSCRPQIMQLNIGSKSEQPALATIQTNCLIAVPSIACTITIPQTKANHGLGTVKISNAATGVEINSELARISYKAPGASCVGLSKVGADGKYKSIGGISVGQKLI